MATKPPVKKRRVKRRRRRRIRKSVLYGLIGIAAAIVLVFSLTTIPKITTDNKLKSLGYSKESIAMIKRQKLTKTILNDKLYSDNLNAALASENFNKDYLRLSGDRFAERGRHAALRPPTGPELSRGLLSEIV